MEWGDWPCCPLACGGKGFLLVQEPVPVWCPGDWVAAMTARRAPWALRCLSNQVAGRSRLNRSKESKNTHTHTHTPRQINTHTATNTNQEHTHKAIHRNTKEHTATHGNTHTHTYIHPPATQQLSSMHHSQKKQTRTEHIVLQRANLTRN